MVGLQIDQAPDEVEPKQRKSDVELPWQVRVVAFFFARPELVPIALACYMIYVFVTQQGEAIASTKIQLSQHVIDSQTEEKLVHEHEGRVETYMRLICVGLAKTDESQNRCLTVR